MPDDQTFRLILAIGMAAFLPVAFYHRIQSQATGETLDRRQEGLFILLTLRPCGLAAMGGLVTFVLNPAWMSWASLPLSTTLRWAGVAVGLPTVALGIWTFRSLGRNITDTVVTRCVIRTKWNADSGVKWNTESGGSGISIPGSGTRKSGKWNVESGGSGTSVPGIVNARR